MKSSAACWRSRHRPHVDGKTAALARHAREGHLRARGVRGLRSPPGSGRSRARRATGAGHLRRTRKVSGDRAVRQRRRRPPSGPLGGCPGDVVLDRRNSGGSSGSDAPRLFDEHRDNVPHQRRTCVRGGRARAVGSRPAREVEGVQVADAQRFRQPPAHDSPREPSRNEARRGCRISSFDFGARSHSVTVLATPSSIQPFPSTTRRAPFNRAPTGCRTSSCGMSTKTRR